MHAFYTHNKVWSFITVSSGLISLVRFCLTLALSNPIQYPSHFGHDPICFWTELGAVGSGDGWWLWVMTPLTQPWDNAGDMEKSLTSSGWNRGGEEWDMCAGPLCPRRPQLHCLRRSRCKHLVLGANKPTPWSQRPRGPLPTGGRVAVMSGHPK